MDFILESLSFIILLPLLVTLFIIFYLNLFNYPSKKFVSIKTLLINFVVLVYCGYLLFNALTTDNFELQKNYSWLSNSFINIEFGVLIDKLSALMGFMVASISFVIQLYSIKFMSKDKSFFRYFAYLNLFIFSMLALVFSSNLVQSYLFWELLGLSSYLLIGFWSEKEKVSKAAKKAFLINRIGDVCFLSAIISLIYFFLNQDYLQNYTLLGFSDIFYWANALWGTMDNKLFDIICIFLFTGAIAKSAQFPLHTWLEDAMQGPTPVSALLHAATMVAAGVYLTARLYPLYSLSITALNFIAIIGLTTAILTALFACVQFDIKKILAFSTSSQLGLMYFALGTGAYSGAICHLFVHGYTKALLFLCVGNILFYIYHQQNLKYLGGIKYKLPLTCFLYAMSCFSLSGLAFSGAISKEIILENTFKYCNIIAIIAILLLTFLTAFYLFRSYFLSFEGIYRDDTKKLFDKKFKSSFLLNIPIVILGVVMIGLTFLLVNFSNFINFNFDYNITNITLQTLKSLHLIAIVLIIAAVIIVAKLNESNKLLIIGNEKNVLYKIFYNKLYINKIYDFIFCKSYNIFCKLCNLVEKYFFNGIVSIVVYIIRFCAFLISKSQSGNVQTYISYAIFMIGIFMLMLLIIYFKIIKG